MVETREEYGLDSACRHRLRIGSFWHSAQLEGYMVVVKRERWGKRWELEVNNGWPVRPLPRSSLQESITFNCNS